MAYSEIQAKRDKAEFERLTNEAELRGDEAEAGLYRIEALNCMQRICMEKAHKPNLGPYSTSNLCYCEDCGKPKSQWVKNEECIP